MKNILLSICLFVSFQASADSNCNQDAITTVSKLTGINKNSLSVLGFIKDDLIFYTFVADTVSESLVYEVMADADSQCYTQGYFEHNFYSDEFDVEKITELSLFYK